MKIKLLKISFLCLFFFITLPKVSADVTKTVGSGGHYATMKQAFDAINAGTIKTGVITLQIISNTTETASAVLNANGSGSARYTSVIIYPTGSGFAISGSFNASLIELKGADNVTIDGRINQTGAANLSIINTNISSVSPRALLFNSDASGNTIQYCYLKGASTGAAGAVVYFSTASSTGNDNNIIDHCNITNAGSRPTNAIYSQGTSGKDNSGNIISNNNIYDIFTTVSSSNGIYVGSFSTSWTITGNSFYETTTLVPTGTWTYRVISLNNTSGNSFLVSDNYIGGTSPQCGGSALIVTSATAHLFQGIYLSVGTTAATSIQNNTIRNIRYSGTQTSPWQGINVTAGAVNIGTVTGNTIGAATGTDSISVYGQANNTNVYGIYLAGTGTVNCQNNLIGSIITTNTTSSYATNFYGIYKNNTAGTVTINNNQIGSIITANSIHASSTSTATDQIVAGIYSDGTGTTGITNNTIANIKNSGTSSNAVLTNATVGIGTYSGVNTISGNTIHDISCANYLIIGILQESIKKNSVQTVNNNTLFNLSNTNTSAVVCVYGISFEVYKSGANTLNQNFMHSFSIASSDKTSIMNGIDLVGGRVTCSNNIINLGVGITNNHRIVGIRENGVVGQVNNVYFNSVYIAGNPSGITDNTYAYFTTSNKGTTDIRNNIFVNVRSGGTTGKHYVIKLPGLAGLTLDYNDYYFSGTGTLLGNLASVDEADLVAWKSATTKDVYSLSVNPEFVAAGGLSVFDYYTAASLPAVAGTGVAVDYSGVGRGATPKMGALETNDFVWQGGTSTNFGTPANWIGGVVPPDGANITFAVNPDRSCLLDQNRILGNIVNAQASDKLDLNRMQLTITKQLILTNGAQLDATGVSSTVVFGGFVAQNIPSGAFVNNSAYALNIDNSNGLTLNGDFTVTQNLILTNGALSIGANTLILNGAINTTSGTLTGGISTNIIVGGGSISSGTTLPAVSLNNLTLNRVLGLSLGGNLDVAGTLTLTDGLLTVGANTLTLSGNSPVRTAGTIDASNAGATLFFGNATAIILPASIFSTSVNNLTINSTGGVTASGDFTVNGILNLQSANPSSTKGKLDMWDGSAIRTLTMGANATTTGVGDVTGIVKRQHTFSNSIQYSFGSQNTTLSFPGIGIMPTEVSCKIVIGTAPSWRATALKRYYSFSQIGGTDRVNVNLSYLDSELDAGEIDETKLVLWDAHGGSPWNSTIEPHGKSNNDLTNNWIGLSGSTINYIAQSVLDNKQWGLSYDPSTKNRWLGTDITTPTKWDVTSNWSGGHVPLATEDVLIPAACPAYPVITLNVAINSIEIESGASVDANSFNITINGYTGAWVNYGTFSPGTGTVIFAHTNNSHVVSITGTTDYFNIQIGSTSWLEPSSNTNLNIYGAIDIVNGGKFDCANTNNTVNYSGLDQIVVNPNGAMPGYHNLILSGSGTKTLPASALSVLGYFNLSGTVSATAASALTILGAVNIGVGTSLTTGNFNHTIGGDFENSGTFNITAGNTMTMNGSIAQSIFGTSASSFYNLDINNINGVSLFVNENVTNVLTFSAGNLTIGTTTLGINGSVIKTNGFLNLSAFSSLSIGGSAALELPADLFSVAPSLNNLTINRPGGVVLGNQNMTVNGLLDLVSGTLTVGANALTLNGLPPTMTSGYIDAGNAGATLNLSCTSAVILPATLFTGSINNLTINVTDGVRVVSDLTVNGILNLQSANPIVTKGSLDMWDGSTIKTLTMGANATTVGVGDVSGIVKRTTINSGIAYTYGNELTTIYFTEDGTLPTEMSAKIKIGTTPSWRTGVINREMEIIQTGGGGTKARVQYHYLDSEVNGNDESRLVFWVGYSASANEFGRSAYNSIDNWINLSNVNVSFFSSSWNGTKNITLDEYSTDSTLIWNGSVSDSWTTPANWTPETGPSSNTNIIIPDASTTPHAPSMPAFTEIKSITLDAAGVLNANVDAQLTINGTSAWINYGGTLNPGSSNVIFKNAAATISGTTNFNNITIKDSAELRITSGGILRIAGTLNNIGVLRAVIVGETTTVEYNGSGDQTVIIPNEATGRYHNLILSGSGVKTLPSSALGIYGNLITSGTVTVNANDTLTIKGNMTVGTGSIFNTGTYPHFIAGDIGNNGTITTEMDGSTTLNGTTTQTISGTGTASFNNLAIANASSGSVQLNNDVNAYILSIAADSKLTINSLAKMNVTGSITNNAGISGLLIKASETAANGTLIFAGAAPLATVEMFSKANWNLLNPVGAKYKWQFFGIPVSTVVASPAFDGAYVRRHDETGVSTNWIQLSNTSTLEPFKGYEVTQELTKIYAFEGELVNADFNRTLVTTSGAKYPGQYIFSNPYTAAIDVTQLTFGTQTEASVYLYNCGSQLDWTTNSGGSTDGTSPGQYTVAPKETAGTGGIPGQIPSMQGFLVYAKSSSDSATFGIPYSSVAIKNTDKQRAPSIEMAAIPQKVFTRIEVIGSRFSDRMWIFSDPTCTRGFDNGWDGSKFMGSGLTPQLYAMEADGDYQVNAVDNINNTELGFKAGEDSIYKLKITNENLYDKYSELYLLDLKENITTDISQSGTEYSFIAQSTATPVKRFKIITSLSGLNAVETRYSMNSKIKIFNSLQNIMVQNQSDVTGELLLYDITGRCFQKIPFGAKTITTIPMDLPAGIYIAKGLTVDEEVTERLILR